MQMSWSAVQKRQLAIFFAVAFGLPLLMAIPMGFGHAAQLDVSIFVMTQMFYPAAGAMLALWMTQPAARLPRIFFGTFLASTAIFMLCCFASLFVSLPWTAVSNVIVILASVIGWIALKLDKKQNRTFAGLRLTKTGGKGYVLLIALFVVLYVLRIVLVGALTLWVHPELANVESTSIQPVYFLVNLAVLPLNFFFVYLPFLGEEYGWRSFLQPLLQQRFGSRRGIVLLGVLWGLWHLPINVFYYSPDTWLLSVINQIVLCVCYAAFFGYAYQKSRCLWVAVILHYFNNNAIVLFASDASISNQVLTVSDVAINLLCLVVLYLPFLFHKILRGSASVLPLESAEQETAPVEAAPEQLPISE
ncbi:MAG: CPBP family intramembrane metalloprotease [Candidatus Fournierella pullistercoris]|uniref:CPBP family intramembrane metalloprotease n=1 Tax=Candidatus Allofournierella pullistercoris TaxID=2838597 RepID=A0A948WSM3_9FIRM|nr:CPBP family intramembrane metalloprotease [Candidatus Fournierella pullistercoris]